MIGQVELRILASRYPNALAALARISALEAELALPAPTVHVVSDVHGEHEKLRQVINNASGSLRPFVAQLFGTITPRELDELLALVYYPHETWAARSPADPKAAALAFVQRGAEIIRALARRYTIERVEQIVPDPFDPVFREILFAPALGRPSDWIARLVAPVLRAGRELALVRMVARVIRNLAVGELVVAGDLGDRGPRIDKVIELLEQQPDVAIAFGNHDCDWIAACLGQPAAVATVVRLSLRYGRTAQLEEGYGISLAPLRELAKIYGDDPAPQFMAKGGSDTQLARMQKAIAIVQLKLEGALVQRHPEWQMGNRALLHRIANGSVTIDGASYPLLDANLPTRDPSSPYVLAPAEQRCIDALVRDFAGSSVLWRQIQFVASRGHMMLRRDRCAIFHGCVPVDAAGNFLPLIVDGEPRAGKALFDALDRVIQRAVRTRDPNDLDLVFYLWTGPLSPCFGKDKMATFETYFIADKAMHAEHKNPYFSLIHDAAFCGRVLREFGVDPDHGYIINGHVPVKLEQGEAPIKRSHRAITIDGAFAAAYGDKGFSLVLDPDRLYLAQHHHFDGADAVVKAGGDLVPSVSDVEVYDRPRTVGDTERGDQLRAEIAALEQLVQAFDDNLVRATGGHV
ncbi:MAG TPA: fructose-bisphosphatase class III [Kofleriaceae bacterium]|jgi:fructose-1,6-bisphosphatase-3|nr:fructose-bisphosphatase class III [Kofleriaceae bacterium]